MTRFILKLSDVVQEYFLNLGANSAACILGDLFACVCNLCSISASFFVLAKFALTSCMCANAFLSFALLRSNVEGSLYG